MTDRQKSAVAKEVAARMHQSMMNTELIMSFEVLLSNIDRDRKKGYSNKEILSSVEFAMTATLEMLKKDHIPTKCGQFVKVTKDV